MDKLTENINFSICDSLFLTYQKAKKNESLTNNRWNATKNISKWSFINLINNIDTKIINNINLNNDDVYMISSTVEHIKLWYGLNPNEATKLVINFITDKIYVDYYKIVKIINANTLDLY